MLLTFRIFIVTLLIGIGILLIFNFFFVHGSQESIRSQHFLPPEKITHDLTAEDVHELLAAHYSFYKDKLSSLYSNMTITLVLGVVCIIILLREEDIEIPGFHTLKIPIKITYLIVPSALCYYWLQFGFLLHDCVGSRIELVRLIQASLKYKGIAGSYQNYFTYTIMNTLKDTGFIDTWFLFYFPELFPISDILTTTKALPLCTMVLVGLLYGIAQGFAMGLPFNWLLRYNTAQKRYKVLVTLLFLTILLLILISHFTFYFGGRNPNWMQIPIVFSAGGIFIFITWSKVRDFHAESLPTNFSSLQAINKSSL